MKILAFGATGYVGGHGARHLAAHGHQVSALCRNQEAAAKLEAEGLIPVLGDLVDRLDEAVALSRDADAVVFAPQLLLEPEYKAVSAFLDAMEGSGKAFIFTSGTGVISKQTGGDWDEESFAEDDPFTPSPHIAPRVRTEDLVRSAASRGIRSIVLRPPLIWGNGWCPVISAFYTSAQKTGAVCYLGNGLGLYSHVHVEDLAELFRLAVEKGTAGALYHAVSGEANYRSMAEVVARKLDLPTRSVSHDEAVKLWGKFLVLVVFNAVSRSRAPRSRNELGWAPSADKLDILNEVVHPAFLSGGE